MTDDDERMDRARRIREIREGGRRDGGTEQDDRDEGDAGEDERADGAATEEPADESVAERTADEAETDEAAGDDEPAPADAETDVDETDDGTETDAPGADDSDAGEDEDDGAGMHVPGAEVGDVDVDVAEMAEQAGLETADGDEVGDGGDAPAAPAGVSAEAETQASEETRVLEFTLGEERYCLDIEYVEEIVKRETVTRVPNTPTFVEGVVDLRGQITTILDPKVPLDIDSEGDRNLIVVFDPEEFEEQGAIGWIVDGVRKVAPVTEDEVNESPTEDDHINGVVDRDDEFVIWTEPAVAIEEASG